MAEVSWNWQTTLGAVVANGESVSLPTVAGYDPSAIDVTKAEVAVGGFAMRVPDVATVTFNTSTVDVGNESGVDWQAGALVYVWAPRKGLAAATGDLDARVTALEQGQQALDERVTALEQAVIA